MWLGGSGGGCGVLGLSNVYRPVLGVGFGILGSRATYAITGLQARVLYRLLTPLRWLSEAQCVAALAGVSPEADVTRVAERAFVHRF